MIFPQQKERRRSAAILITSIIIVLCLVVSGHVSANASTVDGFTDVKAGDYFAGPVSWAVDEGITAGTSATTFSPNKNCTVAEIVTFLWRANGSPSMSGTRDGIDNPFSDVKDSDYYMEAAAWAHKYGIISGSTFNGDAPCTRAMAVTYMWKAAGSPSAKAASFTDIPAGAEYAQAVAWAVEQEITSGTTATTFSPDTVCTRGQIVTFLYRGDEDSKVVLDDEEPELADQPVEPDKWDADTTLANRAPTATTTTVATTATGKATKVGYGAANYPNLTSIDYGTYRKLDYKEKSTLYTYFYDFRTTWYAGAGIDAPEKGPFSNQPGLYGVTASTSGNTLTYTIYTEIGNAKAKSAEFRTYDQAKTIPLTATANKELTASTAKLDNGPYYLVVWFDYTANGKTSTVGVGRVLYVSNGNGYFAERAYKDGDYAMKLFLDKEHDKLASDDAFQAWVEKQGGNDLTKATSLAGVCYPFKSGTSRYPNNTAKWQQLAHQICPDDNAGDYTKLAALYDWMNSNLAYDEDTRAGTGDYRWATAAASNTGTGYTMWDSHVGKCEDFANIYTIMARELGIPAHVMTNTGHAWSIVRIRGHWECVDPTSSMRRAYLGTGNKDFIANAKAYWAGEKTGDAHETQWHGFISTNNTMFKVASYEKSKYATVEAKFASDYFNPLNTYLHDATYFTRWPGTIYMH